VNIDVTNVLRISKQPFAIQIMLDKKLENVEYIIYLCTLILIDSSCTQKFKSLIVMANASYSRKKAVFARNLDLKI